MYAVEVEAEAADVAGGRVGPQTTADTHWHPGNAWTLNENAVSTEGRCVSLPITVIGSRLSTDPTCPPAHLPTCPPAHRPTGPSAHRPIGQPRTATVTPTATATATATAHWPRAITPDGLSSFDALRLGTRAHLVTLETYFLRSRIPHP